MASQQKMGDKNTVHALRVHQWLDEWNKGIEFDESTHKRRPDPYFYIFSISARDLKYLSGINRRTTEGRTLESEDLGIQRRHDEKRSEEIGRFVRFGHPWSELSEAKRKSEEFKTFRKPGWLPTAMVINILKPEDQRRETSVDKNDLVKIDEKDGGEIKIVLPDCFRDKKWSPKLHPIEIIDGQHRLWAFEDEIGDGDFELPVVAFHGLDISWQAYLFWTINIKPKRINASLAFDLYPLLRVEDWLEKSESHLVYRETRAQELTEILWAHPQSPWYHRINMLGDTGLSVPMVSQAAWIRSLTSTLIRSWESKKVGGLFGSKLGGDGSVLGWSRLQQAAFLIFVGQLLKESVAKSNAYWAQKLRSEKNKDDSAFYGKFSLLATDQGIRGILHIINDFCYWEESELELNLWREKIKNDSDEAAVSSLLSSIKGQKLAKFIKEVADELAEYDWRTSSEPSLTADEGTFKSAFRGSGGYKQLRIQLLRFLAKGQSKKIAKIASELLKELKFI